MNRRQKAILGVALGWAVLMLLFPPRAVDVFRLASEDAAGGDAGAVPSDVRYPFLLEEITHEGGDRRLISKGGVLYVSSGLDWERLRWEFQVTAFVTIVLLVLSRGGEGRGGSSGRGTLPAGPAPKRSSLQKQKMTF